MIDENDKSAEAQVGEGIAGRRPDFIGIGAQKAGTTWVFSRLRQHPDVVFPAGKEVHFWDQHSQKGKDSYFAGLRAPQEKKVGDITPAYAILSRSKIQALVDACAGTRFFMILRNPMERAWSLAKMNATQLLKATADIEFEGRPGLKIDDLSDKWWMSQFMMRGSLERGMYDKSLERWLSIVDAEKFLVLDYQDLVMEPRNFLSTISVHCGISGDWFDEQPDSFFYEKIFDGASKPLPRRFKPFLQKLYGESIERVSKMLGRDYSNWLE